MPASIAFGIAVGDPPRRLAHPAAGDAWGGNIEVAGYTELVQHVRADAGTLFAGHVRPAGAEGAIVSQMDLHVWENEPAEGHRDHVAEATVFGTSLARFHRGRSAPDPIAHRPPAAAGRPWGPR